jgi:tight adherence protein C
MSFTPNQLTIFSLVLFAVGSMVGAGALIAAELRRTRSGQVIGRAIRQAAVEPAAPASTVTTQDAEAEATPPSDVELPFHWLDSRLGRALVADEDRNLIDQCGLPSKRAQLVFLVTRVLLAVMLPLVAYVVWSEGHSQRNVIIVLAAAFVIGFMAPKWVLGRLAAGRSFHCSSTCCGCCRAWA